jgi:hypothetical protein
MRFQWQDRGLQERARSLVGLTVEVVRRRTHVGGRDDALTFSDVLLGVEGRFLRFPTAWIALSTIESIAACSHID